MPTFRCLACGGTYRDPGLDDVPYYHACSPAIWVMVTRGLATLTIPLAAVQPNDVEVRRTDRVRPGHRDENVRGGSGPDAREPRSPGPGRVPHPENG